MNLYRVGGAVRDEALGIEPKDIDFVATGAHPDSFLSQGFKQVGNDFPVFLHPETGEEYALARRERKTGAGYNGFTFDIDGVTIDEDLARRDLTINAMARHIKTDKLIDPFDGMSDLKNRILRAVDLNTFVEDPVRVLRLARFAARYGSSWVIDPATFEAAYNVVHSEEWESLTAERVWAETEKALNEPHPWAFFEVLNDLGEYHWFAEIMACDGIPQPVKWHPEGDVFVHTMQALQVAAYENYSLPVKFAALCHDFGKPVTYNERQTLHGHEAAGVQPIHDFCDRLKIPKDLRMLAVITSEFHLKAHKVHELKPKTIVNMFKSADAYGKRDRFVDFLSACECDARARNNITDSYPMKDKVLWLLSVSNNGIKEFTRELVDKGVTGEQVGIRIHARRVHLVAAAKKRTISLAAKNSLT